MLFMRKSVQQMMYLFVIQMADAGGMPQLTQVRHVNLKRIIYQCNSF